jgi:hypothetical protein
MFLKTWCLITLVLAALSLGMSFAHLLEMPAKRRYAGAEWLRVQQTLYPAYANVAGVIEMAAIFAAAVLSGLLRDWRPAMWAAVAGTALLTVAFLFVWLMVTNRVHARTSGWTTDTLPEDWQSWRGRWDASHIARLVLHLAGFAMLVLATLISPLSED